jgi:hypothetical protein
MKDIILPIWGALVVSGWWALAVFNDLSPEVLVAIMTPTILLSVGLSVYVFTNICTYWD